MKKRSNSKFKIVSRTGRSQLADAKLLKKFVEYGDRSSEV